MDSWSGESSPRTGSGFARIPILRALGQTPCEVVIRKPGDRFLSAPLPIASYAQRHWEFAWASALVSTGHSLGGGLAQQFAYALPADPTGAVPRVTEVYAFAPSPVTGFFSVARELRDSNKRALTIDRIYERGEILALARSLMSLGPSRQTGRRLNPSVA